MQKTVTKLPNLRGGIGRCMSLQLMVVYCLVMALVILATPPKAAALSLGCTSPIMLTELQTGAAPAGSTSTNFRYEFVELYNCTDTSVGLDSYSLRLKNAAGAVTATVPLTGVLSAQSFTWAVHNSYQTYLGAVAPTPAIVFAVGTGNLNALAADGGSVELLGPSEEVMDHVVYGPQAPENAPVPPSGQSIKRCSLEGAFANTTVYANDFVITSPPTLSALFTMGPACPTVDPPAEEPPTDEPSACAVVLSEILPNPAGADTGQEFIELHNPTNQPVNLAGCSLRLNEGTPFILPNEQLAPGGYRVLYDAETGITLPNSAGGTVWLLSEMTEQAVTYPANLGDNQAWALFEEWSMTLKPTPGILNELLTSLPDREEGMLTLCPEGQERNPVTNRCRVLAVTTQQPCKVGQERNPETNRCRNVASAAAAPTTCKAGQERNPETNRCRNIAEAEAVKPCEEGYERNPQTNRCRKVLATNLPKTVEDVSAPTSADPKWWLAGVAGVGLAGYGIYEWRRDIANGFGKLKHKIGGKPGS